MTSAENAAIKEVWAKESGKVPKVFMVYSSYSKERQAPGAHKAWYNPPTPSRKESRFLKR
jgi:hypothetical protein